MGLGEDVFVPDLVPDPEYVSKGLLHLAVTLWVVLPPVVPDLSGVAHREAIIRLVGAVLAEQHDAWAEQRRYIGLDVLTRCRHALPPTTPGQEETAVAVPALTA